MQDPGALSWTTVVSRGVSKRVITPRFQNKQKNGNDGDIKLISKVIYEDADLKDQLVARKATALVQQALTPGSVLFSFPASLFKHRTDAYDEIVKQCGATVGDGGLRCISQYGQRTTGDLMVEALFASAEGTHKALSAGVEVGDVTYKASLSHDKLIGDSIVHVQLNILRMCDEATFVSELTRSLRYYGRVIQMKKFTCRGYFEGQVSVILDTSVGYLNADGDMVPCESLTRLLYLREWDVYAPASFKGAAPVCHFCRQSGHVRKKCPDLAKRKCFNCRGFGHTARFCKVEKGDGELIQDYLELSSDTGDKIQDEANGEKDDAEMPLALEEKDFNASHTGTAASKFASFDVALSMDTREPTYESEVAADADACGVSGVSGGVSGACGTSDIPGFAGAGAGVPGVSGAVVSVGVSGTQGGNGRSGSGSGSGSKKNDGKPSLLKPNADHMSKAKQYVNENKKGFTLKNSSSSGSARKHFRVGSLNARSIFKASNPTLQREFTSFLRKRSSVDILCLQEVSSFHEDQLSDAHISQFSSFLFPSSPSPSSSSVVVTKHCAIVCLKPGLYLANTAIFLDGRCVVASVMDSQHNLLCHVANVYVPAKAELRPAFLRSLKSLPVFSDLSIDEPWLLLGDFNTRLTSSSVTNSQSVSAWFDWLRRHFNNCHPSGLPTFTRGDTRSTIDFIFGHTSLATRLINGSLQYLPSAWTDHSLLTIDLVPARVDVGPGCWRFNPTLLDDGEFLVLLDKTVALFFDSAGGGCDAHVPGAGVGAHSSACGRGEPRSPQALWESFKLLLKCCAQRYTCGAKARFKNKVMKLQQERAETLSSSVSGIITSDAMFNHSTLSSSLGDSERLKKLDALIDSQIQKETRESMLRSATRWHEMGERNNKYFYRVIKERQSQQTIQSLKCSTTGSILVDAADIMKEARGFYKDLYTPDDIDAEAIDALLASIPSEVVLSAAMSDALVKPPDAADILLLLKHAPKGKSPGLDGLPFEVYQYLVSRSKAFADLLLSVLKDAFAGIFPVSWQQTRMVLLFKKGDPLLLKNWRPLSLINSDAKLFTKLLANRFNVVLPSLVNPYQTGFMPGRLISDNGWINQTFMANARSVSKDIPQVACLLDQEKAYDRVHPTYLRQVLLRFGFPSSLVSCLCSLFFGTEISISINGWLGVPIPQLRGLRQGDPLSPLLFNLAFEPLLRSIFACPGLPGVSLAAPKVPRWFKPAPAKVYIDTPDTADLDFISTSFESPPPAVKLLSYADDLEVFLSCPGEWPVLLSLLDCYGRASNAKVNLGKTVLVSLSGVRHADWVDIASSEGVEWHDSTSSGSVRYLGYPLYHNQDQLLVFLDEIKVKILRHSNILRQRHLSIRGSGLVANSLLLSRVWHLLRVVPAPVKWLNEIKSLVCNFMLPFWPRPAWSNLCLSRKFGGVGLVDVKDQSLALHLIYLQRLLRGPSGSDFVSPWLVRCYQLYTGHASVLPWLLYPKKFKHMLSDMPTLAHLTSLVLKLPPLVLSPSWPSRWYLDVPLSCVVSAGVSRSLRTTTVQPASLSMRYLLSDIHSWNQGRRALIRKPLSTSRSSLLKSVYMELYPFFFGDATLFLLPEIAAHTALSYEDMDSLFPSQSYLGADVSAWLPDCSNWVVPTSLASFCPTVSLSLGNLRRFWHKDYSLITARIGPPQVVPIRFLLRPFFWRRFWFLPMTCKAFTPWWRLLQDCIGYRSRLHRWSPNKFDSPDCPICLISTEDLFHFVAGCFCKWRYWSEVLSLVHLNDAFPAEIDVWSGLVTMSSVSGQPLDQRILCFLGSAFATLWRYHWRCVLDSQEWCSITALNMFKQDHHGLVLSMLDSSDVTPSFDISLSDIA